jgi:type IV pilus assembly protein PilC
VPVFKYTAVAADGSTVKASADAYSAQSLENELLTQQLRPVRITEKRSLLQLELTKKRVPRSEVMHFSRQMAAFVRTGIPIGDALEVSAEGAKSERFADILRDVRESVQAGVSFPAAIGAHAEVFPPYYLGILRSAELTGHLDTVLDQLAGYIERDLEARSKVKSALTYPLVVLGMSLVTVVIMVAFVLPRFVTFFEDLDSSLPMTTRALLGFSAFTQDYWWAFLLATLAIVGLAVWSKKSPTGRRVRHRVMLRLPLVGEIAQYAAVERLCRVMAAMMSAGVPIPRARRNDRGRGHLPAARRHRPHAPRRAPDDPRGRGDGHHGPAARGCLPLLRAGARVPAEEAHHPVRACGHHLHGPRRGVRGGGAHPGHVRRLPGHGEPVSRRRGALRDDDRGETLIELIATLIVLGLGVAAVISGLFSLVGASDYYKRASIANNVLLDYSEALKGYGAGDPYAYQPCATTSTYPAFTSAEYPGYTATVVEVRYWDGTTKQGSSPTSGWNSTCGTDTGAQRLVLQVQSPEGANSNDAIETVTVVKRNRTCAPTATAPSSTTPAGATC